jgi:dipeptidyl aminopeptidase/acylaminoacyl peptidase
MAEPTIAPFGSWTSPFSADMAAAGSVRLEAPTILGDRVYWLEARPQEDGRVVLVLHENGATRDVTPEQFSVRTGVHEYGGGSYLISDDTVYFSNWSDQRLYRQDLGGEPVPITPEAPVPGSWRYADGTLFQGGIVCVRERHETGGVINELVLIDGTSDPVVLVGGHDFFSSPRMSPDGASLIWLTWDHPNMPWDGCELWSAEYLGGGELGPRRRLAGNPNESIVQPEWGPDGSLYWFSDRSGYWNLYRDNRPIAPMDADCAGPAWRFGSTYFGPLSDGRVLLTVTREGFDRLVVVDSGGDQSALPTPPGTHRGNLATDGDHTAVAISGSASTRGAVLKIDVTTGVIETLRSVGSFDSAYVSRAQPITFPSDDGPTHAFFYAPHNPDFQGPKDELPPLVVFSHGGPTSASRPDLDPEIQFFTSRGLAVVDVNYGGSTGYGRRYRQRLRGTWGIVDARDCIAAAKHLASRRLVDGDRMAIRGGSAGGFTALTALTFHNVFQVGASYYGVADLEAMASDTHKFESRYLDYLIGPYTEMAGIYRQRSPINFADRLSCPVILFQGLDDRVVPPSQALALVQALKDHGIPYVYVPFMGEQHGFRQAKNIASALTQELSFYGQALDFVPKDVPLLLRQNVTTLDPKRRGPRSHS